PICHACNELNHACIKYLLFKTYHRIARYTVTARPHYTGSEAYTKYVCMYRELLVKIDRLYCHLLRFTLRCFGFGRARIRTGCEMPCIHIYAHVFGCVLYLLLEGGNDGYIMLDV